MTTLANISGLDTIIFDSSDQQIANTTLAVLGLLAFFANVFIIYGGSKNSKATNTMLILLSLCCADVIMSFFMTIISCLNSITNGWVGGKMTCIISEIVTETTGLVTLTSMMLISLLNFIKIFKGVRVTDTTTLIFIAVIWTLSIALSAVVYTIYGFEEFVYLGTSKTVCTIAWHNPAGFPKTVGLIYLVIILLSLFLLITVECIFLYNYYQHKRNKRRITGQQEDNSINQNENRMIEYRLVSKIILILLVYLVCWAPQVWFIITSILTEIPPNFQNDYNAKLFAAIRRLANPALILSFDSSIRKQVWIFVGLATANSQASIPARTPTSLRASRKLTKDISSMDEFRATNTDHGVQPSISNISKVLEIIRTKSADADLGYSNLSVPTSPSENFKKRHIGGRGIDENSLKSPDLASNAESDDEAKGKNGNIIIGLKSEPESTTSSRTTSNFSNTNKNIDADQITVSHSNQSRTRRSRPHEETSLGRRPAEEHSIASIRHMMDARSNRAAEENSLGKRPMGESSMTSIRAQSLFDSESLVPDRVLTRRHSPINGDTATSSSASPSIINFNDTENPSQASSSRNLASKSDGSSSPKKRSPKEYDQSASIVSNLKNNIPSVLQEEPNTINNDGSIRNFDLGNISDHGSGQKPRKHSPNGNDPRDSDRQSYDQVQTVPHKIRVHGNLESSLVSSSPSSPGSPPSFKASSDFRSSSRVQSSSNSQTGSRANVASGRDSLKMGSTTESQRMIIIEEKSGMESDGELRKNI